MKIKNIPDKLNVWKKLVLNRYFLTFAFAPLYLKYSLHGLKDLNILLSSDVDCTLAAVLLLLKTTKDMSIRGLHTPML